MAKQTNRVAWGLAVVLGLAVLGSTGVLLYESLSPKLQQVALVEAAKQGDVAAVRRLLENRVDPDVPPPGRRALNYAISSGHAAVVTSLLAYGASVKPGGAFETDPVAEAVAARQPSIIKILLAHGANANNQDPKGMQTLLHLAFFGRDPAVMQALLAGGANPNMTDRRQRTIALMWAARGNELAMVQALIAHGANVNARNQNGETVLMWAVRGGHLPVIRHLIAHGADVNAENVGNRSPYTALMLAQEGVRILKRQRDRGFRSERASYDQSVKNESELIRYLKQAGAKG